jgi:hypothetical protein
VRIVGLVSGIRFSAIHDMFGHLHVVHNMCEILGGNYHIK